MNAAERRLALASALSLKFLDGKVRIIDTLSPKTADMVKSVSSLTEVGSILFVTTAAETPKAQGINNIAHSHVDVVTHLSPAEILKYDFCVFTTSAMAELSEHFTLLK